MISNLNWKSTSVHLTPPFTATTKYVGSPFPTFYRHHNSVVSILHFFHYHTKEDLCIGEHKRGKNVAFNNFSCNFTEAMIAKTVIPENLVRSALTLRDLHLFTYRNLIEECSALYVHMFILVNFSKLTHYHKTFSYDFICIHCYL